MTSLLGSKHEHAGDFEEPYVCYVLSNLFSSDSGDTWLSLVVCLNERSRPEIRVGHRRKPIRRRHLYSSSGVINRLFSRQLRTIKNRSVG
jgi:hypothetical protein